MSWQDLKDFCRDVAAPEYTDVYRDRGITKGFVLFLSFHLSFLFFSFLSFSLDN